MRRVLSLVLAVALVAVLGVQLVFADSAYPGESVSVTGFVDKNGNEQSDGWSTEYYKVSASWSAGKNYVDKVYINNDDGMVYVRLRAGINVNEDKPIKGTIRITETDGNRGVYTLKLEEGDLYLTKPEDLFIYATGNNTFSLPTSYASARIRFVEESSGAKNGTLDTELTEQDDTVEIAHYKGKIFEQPPLYLYANTYEVMDIIKKYEDADLRFRTWPAKPSFDIPGKLTIYMEKSEYLYQIGENNKLTQVDAVYDSDLGGYTISTGTFGSYVISDVKLSGAAAGTTSSAPPSSSTAPPPPASSKPASSVAPPPPPASSSVAPPPPASSSVAPPASPSSAPESSSSEAESSEPESSEPEVSEPESSEPESSSSAPVVKPESDKGDFPLVPVLIGVVVVLVGGIAVYFVMANKKGKGGKDYDSWDD